MMMIKLRTKKVQGDGHCLYRAIMQSFAGGLLTRPQENAAAINFRNTVTKHICTHPAKFKPMFEEEKNEDHYLARYPTFKDYCVAARRPHSRLYGGRLDLQAAADILHANVMVHWPKNKTTPRDAPSLTFKSPSSIRQNAPTIIRVQKTTDDHYDAIVAVQTQGPPVKKTPSKKKKKKKKTIAKKRKTASRRLTSL